MNEEANTYETVDAINLLRSYSRHRDFIRLALRRVANEIGERAEVHDASKLLDDEFSGFSRINHAARVKKFGSEEYNAGMRAERGVIDLHFKRNSHHPERAALLVSQPYQGSEAEQAYQLGRSENEMTFLDVIEMVCDWWGARKGYDDTRSWEESSKLNLDAKGKYLTPEQRWLAEQVVMFLGQRP
jgi:Family of unknown function (DUF5662)